MNVFNCMYFLDNKILNLYKSVTFTGNKKRINHIMKN